MNKEIGEGKSREHARRNAALGFIIGMLLGGLLDLVTGDLGIASVLGMVLGAVLGAVIGYRGFNGIDLMEYPPEVVRNLAISGILFLAVLAGAILLISRGASEPLVTLAAVAPLIPGFYFFLSIGRAIGSLDEFQRRLQLEGLAIGFGLALLAVLTYGLLGLTGLPQPSWLWATLVMIFCWLVGKLWVRWKYR